jgi:NADPH:quinone reductase
MTVSRPADRMPLRTRAVVLRGPRPVEDPDCFAELDMPLPALGPRDLLVRVRAVSVNPVDVKVRRRATDAAPRVLGWDAAGEVVAAGAGCVLFGPGAPVYYAGDFERPGCDAELHVVDERIVGRMPATLDFAQAAALPLTALTAWEALFERLEVRPAGQGPGNGHLLVIGGAGGVGSMAIQLARLAGLDVTATASRPASTDWVRALGATRVLDHARPLAPQLAEQGLPAPQYILNCNETDPWFDAMAELIAPQGRICVLASARERHNVQALMDKAAALVWENIFAKSAYGTPDLESQHRILEQVADRIEDGRLRTTLREVVGPLTAAGLREAHARLESGRSIGKLVLTA